MKLKVAWYIKMQKHNNFVHLKITAVELQNNDPSTNRMRIFKAVANSRIVDLQRSAQDNDLQHQKAGNGRKVSKLIGRNIRRKISLALSESPPQERTIVCTSFSPISPMTRHLS